MNLYYHCISTRCQDKFRVYRTVSTKAVSLLARLCYWDLEVKVLAHIIEVAKGGKTLGHNFAAARNHRGTVDRAPAGPHGNMEIVAIHC